MLDNLPSTEPLASQIKLMGIALFSRQNVHLSVETEMDISGMHNKVKLRNQVIAPCANGREISTMARPALGVPVAVTLIAFTICLPATAELDN